MFSLKQRRIRDAQVKCYKSNSNRLSLYSVTPKKFKLSGLSKY